MKVVLLGIGPSGMDPERLRKLLQLSSASAASAALQLVHLPDDSSLEAIKGTKADLIIVDSLGGHPSIDKIDFGELEVRALAREDPVVMALKALPDPVAYDHDAYNPRLEKKLRKQERRAAFRSKRDRRHNK